MSVSHSCPSPQFFLDFSPSFRTTIADAYWLQMIQYYGEHITTIRSTTG